MVHHCTVLLLVPEHPNPRLLNTAVIHYCCMCRWQEVAEPGWAWLGGSAAHGAATGWGGWLCCMCFSSFLDQQFRQEMFSSDGCGPRQQAETHKPLQVRDRIWLTHRHLHFSLWDKARHLAKLKAKGQRSRLHPLPGRNLNVTWQRV